MESGGKRHAPTAHSNLASIPDFCGQLITASKFRIGGISALRRHKYHRLK